jgi:hypothetical protein
VKRALLLVVLAASAPRIARADDDTIAPMAQPELGDQDRHVTAEAALVVNGDGAAGMLDLRAALAMARGVSVGARLPLLSGSLDAPSGTEAGGTALGDAALSIAFARRIPIDAGGSYRVGLRAVVTVPSATGDEELARTFAQIELAHTPGEIFNSEVATRLELAVRWEACNGGYELAGLVGTANYVFGDEGVDSRFGFWGVSAGGAMRVGGVELLAEGFLVDENYRNVRSIDLGARLVGAGSLTMRGFATFIDDERYYGLSIAASLSAAR